MSKDILKVAIEAARVAGKVLLDNISNKHQTQFSDQVFEGYQTIKADIDLIAETAILEVIRKNFPNHAILAEESGFHEGKNNSNFTWIIDPLHDTVAYTRGNQPEFSITIAVAKDNVVLQSLLYQPILDKMYWAIKAQGTFLNGKAIHVSDVNSIVDANLSIQHNVFKYGAYEKLVPIIKKVKRMYALGSAMFPELADGKVDMVVSYKQALYDYAAAKLLVEEAGGKVTNEKGQDLPIYFDNERRFTIVASNGLLHDFLLENLNS
jgi:myo-inositol-1(or 4)-monophosphatase